MDLLCEHSHHQVQMDNHAIVEFQFHEVRYGEGLLILHNTQYHQIASFIGFRYSNKCVAKMTFEAKYPHNLVLKLQSGT